MADSTKSTVPPQEAAMSASQKKKARKKKQKAEAQNAINDEIEEIKMSEDFLRRFPEPCFFVRSSASKGRFLTASKPIAAGDIVIQENSYAFVPFGELLDRVCFKCGKERDATEGDCSTCETCKSILYCSDACKEDDATSHARECAVFQNIAKLCQEHSVEPNLIRLIMRVDSARSRELTSKGPVGLHTGTFAEVAAMVDHVNDMAADWRKVVASASEALLKLLTPLPEVPSLEVDELLKIGGRINSNSHVLVSTLNERHYGVGLYPTISLTSHSCDPNLYFVPSFEGPNYSKLILRALRDIKVGEELTISYIDLYTPRAARQKLLLDTKSFHCKCARCVEPLTASSRDGQIEGIVCMQKKCNGLLTPSSRMANKAAIKASQVPQGTQLPASQNGNSEVSVWRCAQCGAMEETSVIEKLFSEAEATLNKLSEAMDKREDNARTISGLELFMRRYSNLETPSAAKSVPGDLKLPPHHHFVLLGYLKLMNMNIRLGQHVAAARFCKLYAEAHKAILPANHLETSNTYQHLGELYKEQIEVKAGKTSKAVLQSLLKSKQEAFQACASMRRICLGPTHPETMDVEKLAK